MYWYSKTLEAFETDANTARNNVAPSTVGVLPNYAPTLSIRQSVRASSLFWSTRPILPRPAPSVGIVRRRIESVRVDFAVRNAATASMRITMPLRFYASEVYLCWQGFRQKANRSRTAILCLSLKPLERPPTKTTGWEYSEPQAASL